MTDLEKEIDRACNEHFPKFYPVSVVKAFRDGAKWGILKAAEELESKYGDASKPMIKTIMELLEKQ